MALVLVLLGAAAAGGGRTPLFFAPASAADQQQRLSELCKFGATGGPPACPAANVSDLRPEEELLCAVTAPGSESQHRRVREALCERKRLRVLMIGGSMTARAGCYGQEACEWSLQREMQFPQLTSQQASDAVWNGTYVSSFLARGVRQWYPGVDVDVVNLGVTGSGIEAFGSMWNCLAGLMLKLEPDLLVMEHALNIHPMGEQFRTIADEYIARATSLPGQPAVLLLNLPLWCQRKFRCVQSDLEVPLLQQALANRDHAGVRDEHILAESAQRSGAAAVSMWEALAPVTTKAGFSFFSADQVHGVHAVTESQAALAASGKLSAAEGAQPAVYHRYIAETIGAWLRAVVDGRMRPLSPAPNVHVSTPFARCFVFDRPRTSIDLAVSPASARGLSCAVAVAAAGKKVRPAVAVPTGQTLVSRLKSGVHPLDAGDLTNASLSSPMRWPKLRRGWEWVGALSSRGWFEMPYSINGLAGLQVTDGRWRHVMSMLDRDGKFRQALYSVRVRDEAWLHVDASPGGSRRIGNGSLTAGFLSSRVGLGNAELSCVNGCRCDAITLAGYDSKAKHTEVVINRTRYWDGGARCTLRLTNVGSGAAKHSPIFAFKFVTVLPDALAPN
eukprot:TRINITY_DN16652_c0_g1_i2.p1 TRINITY_DN16652_c0_g1~~TRINITY_DN16652_c0_g1_i2.p1  ORF type:complete len:634 (+),score=106.06 TRINITY_DN16652_c0_g1_i2:56-1903(+)